MSGRFGVGFSPVDLFIVLKGLNGNGACRLRYFSSRNNQVIVVERDVRRELDRARG